MLRKKKVLVAMSGGVDSSTAAAMLKRDGYYVIGATMKLWDDDACFKRRDPKRCCSLKGIEDARRVAAKIRIPHYVFDMSDDFRRLVIDYFCDSYMEGVTPNPCILCNEKLKFDILCKKARKLGCTRIATGHYCGIARSCRTGRYSVREAKDKAKDQSYFLFSLRQPALSRALFPLGNLTKNDVRTLARKNGIRVHNKPASQDVCFVEDDYAGLIARATGREIGPGDILNSRNETIGRHKGFIHYTIGQRKGLGIAHTEPLYVIRIDSEANTIGVGPKSEVYGRELSVRDCTWGAVSGIKRRRKAMVKIRYGHKKAAATIMAGKGDECRVKFDEPQLAPTPGQAAVFYDKDIVLGGGWITKAETLSKA